MHISQLPDKASVSANAGSAKTCPDVTFGPWPPRTGARVGPRFPPGPDARIQRPGRTLPQEISIPRIARTSTVSVATGPHRPVRMPVVRHPIPYAPEGTSLCSPDAGATTGVDAMSADLASHIYHWGCALAECPIERRPFSPCQGANDGQTFPPMAAKSAASTTPPAPIHMADGAIRSTPTEPGSSRQRSRKAPIRRRTSGAASPTTSNTWRPTRNWPPPQGPARHDRAQQPLETGPRGPDDAGRSGRSLVRSLRRLRQQRPRGPVGDRRVVPPLPRHPCHHEICQFLTRPPLPVPPSRRPRTTSPRRTA